MKREWKIKTHAQSCSISGKAFQSGDRVISSILRNAEGEIIRRDVLADSQEFINEDLDILGRWSFSILDQESSLSDGDQSGGIELFRSLFQEEENSDEDREELKFYLALLLERKRMLSCVGKNKTIIRYKVRGENDEYPVPNLSVDADKLMEFTDVLLDLV